MPVKRFVAVYILYTCWRSSIFYTNVPFNTQNYFYNNCYLSFKWQKM